MFRCLTAVCIVSSAMAFFASPATTVARRLLMSSGTTVGQGRALPGMKPRPDGTFGVAGEHLPQYVLEMDNGAKAIVRTYGGNLFTWITKDGIEIMGKRKDAAAVGEDSKVCLSNT